MPADFLPLFLYKNGMHCIRLASISSNSQTWIKWIECCIVENVSAKNHNQIDRILSSYVSWNAASKALSLLRALSLSLSAYFLFYEYSTQNIEIYFYFLVRIIIYSDSFEGLTINAS